MKDKATRGFRIVVHSRFDERVDPLIDAPTLSFDPALEFPHIDLRLYNPTGNGITGFHYDPVFTERPRTKSPSEDRKK